MNSMLENNGIKSKCQIFTPHDVVVEMLDGIGYSCDIYGKRILENSCGNGRFLTEIVRRYISDAQAKGLTTTEIKLGIESDIWGAELDKEKYDECICTLNKLTQESGIDGVKWNIYNRDSLREPFQGTYDFIVGNPPYLSYWDLPEEERSYLKGKYTSCSSGAFDYCFAFIEEATGQLSENGKLSYIIPASIFKTRSAKSLRKLIKPLLVKIVDYKTKAVFTDATTSSAVIMLQHENQRDTISYYDVPSQKSFSIPTKNLDDNLWVFNRNSNADLRLEKRRFGDYFDVSSSVATQYNAAYVLTKWTVNGNYLVSNEGARIELSAVRPAVRPKRKSTDTPEYIIFPYAYEDGKLIRYEEENYKKLFPMAYEYLKKSKKKLDERAADKKAAWYEYGRSQALLKLNQEKILLCPVVSKTVQAWKISKEEVPYSGFFILAKDGSNLDDALDIITSDRFIKYIKSVGINANGNSIRFSTRNVENYVW